MSTSYTRFRTTEPDADRAVDALIDAIGHSSPTVLFLFTEMGRDLDALARALHGRINGTILACTTAGGLTSDGYVDQGFSAAAVTSDDLSVRQWAIEDVQEFGPQAAQEAVTALKLDEALDGPVDRFGVLLIDGMSRAEERVTALLSGASNGLPLVGGSAGDAGTFTETLVYDGERFRSGIASLTVFESRIPTSLFRFQHFAERSDRAVVTAANVATREILEIDGEPAVQAYRRLLQQQELTPSLVAKHPLLLKAGDGEPFARGIQDWDDRSIRLFCAVESGMVVRIGNAGDLVSSLGTQLDALRPGGREAGLTIAFDCVLRRAEVQHESDDERLAETLCHHPIVGFSTYGEQFNGFHINQTMTGVSFAA